MVGVAIAGAAVVGAGASMLASDKASDASKSATKANNALQQQIYQSNAAALAPYQTNGQAANSAIAALLGLPTQSITAPTVPGAPVGTATRGDYINYLSGMIGPQRTRQYQAYFAANPNLTEQQKIAYLQALANGKEAKAFAQYASANPLAPDKPAITAGAAGPTSALDAQKAAFDQFRNSTGYQFRVSEGEKALGASLGNRGMLDSGAARKAALQFGQNIASDEFGKYYNMLTGQQGVGLTAASAQAGVGQNYANATSANNNLNAQNQGNAALSNANQINNALGSALSAYGMSQGMGTSYGGSGGGGGGTVWGGL